MLLSVSVSVCRYVWMYACLVMMRCPSSPVPPPPVLLGSAFFSIFFFEEVTASDTYPSQIGFYTRFIVLYPPLPETAEWSMDDRGVW